jgi:hypothetical protein
VKLVNRATKGIVVDTHGFILRTWTGICEDEGGLPRFFGTIDAARAAFEDYPSWGRQALEIWSCTVRPKPNGVPDYVLHHWEGS